MFVKYYLGIVLKSYREFESRVEHTQNRKLSKPERVKNLFIKRVGKLSKSEIAIICPDISISTIETTLAALVKEGFVLKVGAGKNTAYIRDSKKETKV